MSALGFVGSTPTISRKHSLAINSKSIFLSIEGQFMSSFYTYNFFHKLCERVGRTPDQAKEISFYVPIKVHMPRSKLIDMFKNIFTKQREIYYIGVDFMRKFEDQPPMPVFLNGELKAIEHRNMFDPSDKNFPRILVFDIGRQEIVTVSLIDIYCVRAEGEIYEVLEDAEYESLRTSIVLK